MDNYIVYIKTDTENRIISINSSAFLQGVTDWTQIDEGLGDKYHHAQGNYLEKGLVDEHGRYNYRYVDGQVVEIPETEKPPIPRTAPVPSMMERLEAVESAILEVVLGG